jgi:uncharacterized FlaG/YvyC family protein
MPCKTKKKSTNQQAKKTPKNEEMNEKLESHVKKMPNHAKFDKIHKCLMYNVIIDFDSSIKVISHNKG